MSRGRPTIPAINTIRARQQRNFIATLLLSQGVPMLLHGDELGRTQQGNNNGYAQDNELTWIDWENVDQPLVEFTAALARLRRDHPTFRRRRFFNGRPVRMEAGQQRRDIAWLRPDGTLMQPEDWGSGFGRAVGVFLNGRGIRERDYRGEPIVDKHFIVLFNAGDDIIDFHTPVIDDSPKWNVLIDTAGEKADSEPLEPGRYRPTPREGAHGACRAQRRRARHRPLGRRIAGGTDRHDDARPLAEGGAGALIVAATPRSTYRLQIRRDFDLDAAAEVTGYLRDLGVSWAYLSPLLKATEGSDHGYDVVDPSQIDPARGGADGLDRFAAAARAAGLGILIDTVPNHMGISQPMQNPWWWDVLTYGRDSRYAEAFDIDWDFGGGKVRVPILGAGIDEVIAQGQVAIDPAATDLAPHGVARFYDEHVLPLATDSISVPVGGLGGAALDDPRVIEQVLAQQHWEAIFWRREAAELNYRRFFAVTTLAGVRVEIPWVFDESHAEVLRWVREGLADGLRVDHPDGLVDPGGYLERLAAETGSAYVLVEKILEHGEELPAWWETDGTTGYDALGEIDRVLIDPAGERGLAALDAQLRADTRGGDQLDYPDLIHETKRMIADTIQRAEIARLVRELPDLDSTSGGAGARCARRAAGVLSGLPLLPAGGPRTARPRRRRGLGTATRSRGDDRPACAGARRPRPRRRAPIPADHRSGHGQGRRRHGVLPLHPARLPDRGRRRPVGVRPLGRRLPPRAGAASGILARLDDHALHARHEARRGRPRPPRRAGRDAGSVGGGARTAPRLAHRPATVPSTTSSTKPSSDRGPRPGIACTRTPRRPREKPPRRPAGGIRTLRSRSACTPRWTPSSTTPTWRRSSPISSPRSRPPGGPTACRPSCCSSPAPASRTSIRVPSCGRHPSSILTTGAPSTSTSDDGCWRRWTPDSPGLSCPTWMRLRPRSCWSPRVRCACGATAPTCSRSTGR